jgi:DNA repair protein RadC
MRESSAVIRNLVQNPQCNQPDGISPVVALVAEWLSLGGLELDKCLDRAVQVLEWAGGSHGLSGLSPPALAKAAGLEVDMVRAFQLGMKIEEHLLVSSEPLARVSGSVDVYRRFAHLSVSTRESFWVIGLGSRNQVLLEERVAEGAANLCIIQPRDVFAPLVARAALRVVFIHNHPSGDPDPSQEDLEMTDRLSDAGKLLGIQVLDHVIIGKHGYRSLLDDGLLGGNS